MIGGDKQGEGKRIRKLAEFKTTLEKKINETEETLESLKILVDFINQILLEKSFQRAADAKPKSSQTSAIQPPPIGKTIVPLKTVNGDLLANLYISKDSMRVTLAKDKEFNEKIPPFHQFLVDRVLNKMRVKDNEALSKGEIDADQVFSYRIVSDGDLLREITIERVTPQRRRELKSSIHWTLEKMYEKMEQKQS